MTQQFTPAQLEAWAGLGPFLDCEDEYLNKCVYPRQEQEDAGIALLLAAPDLARLVLERDAENARLREGLTHIDALDPEWQGIESLGNDAVRGLVLRMGEIARATLKGDSHD